MALNGLYDLDRYLTVSGFVPAPDDRRRSLLEIAYSGAVAAASRSAISGGIGDATEAQGLGIILGEAGYTPPAPVELPPSTFKVAPPEVRAPRALNMIRQWAGSVMARHSVDRGSSQPLAA